MSASNTASDIRYAISETQSICTELRDIAETVRKSAKNVGEDKFYQGLCAYISSLENSVSCMRRVVG